MQDKFPIIVYGEDGTYIRDLLLDFIDKFGSQLLDDKVHVEPPEPFSFKKALLASGNATLTHSIGKRKESDTILTAKEFCSRLTAIRQRLKEEQKKELENTKNLNF